MISILHQVIIRKNKSAIGRNDSKLVLCIKITHALITKLYGMNTNYFVYQIVILLDRVTTSLYND